MTPTPKPIRCWAVYMGKSKKPYHIDTQKQIPMLAEDTIIPGQFVPDKPKKRKGK